MSITISAVENQTNQTVPITIDGIPDCCPICKTHGQPDVRGARHNLPVRTAHVVFQCPVKDCRAMYLAVYQNRSSSVFVLVGTPLRRFVREKEFQQNIKDVSIDFCKIYNQALVAEENNLDQICGPGYRKALEFLIKDYLIKHIFATDAAKQEDVKKAFLANAIKDFIPEKRIKECAKLATWLGNDETHYLRTWLDKDLQDLKSLIVMTVGYIDSEIEAEKYLKAMPSPK